jgi:hypothetical protein
LVTKAINAISFYVVNGLVTGANDVVEQIVGCKPLGV